MWPQTEETQNLLRDARDGNSEAVNDLLARHREAIRKMISLRLDPRLERRLDASDVVQDVLVEASRRLETYLANPVMPFHLWLRQLAKDHLIDAHRRHRKARKRSVDRERPIDSPALPDRSSLNLAQQLVATEMTPAAAAMRRELELKFAEALRELSDDDREIIIMRHFEQLPNQDLARALGISEPAASMRYIRAMRRLRKRLGQDDGTS